MSGIDIEGTLSDHFVMLAELEGDGPPHEWRCQCGAKFGFSDSAIAHVAAVLREQIVTWLTSEALRTDLLAQVNAEDDAQFAGGASHGLGAHDATDFVLAALAAHLSDTERAGGAASRAAAQITKSAERMRETTVRGRPGLQKATDPTTSPPNPSTNEGEQHG